MKATDHDGCSPHRRQFVRPQYIGRLYEVLGLSCDRSSPTARPLYTSWMQAQTAE
ncbi:MAG: hypothetical protein AAFV72_10335 [Cyanobacteria bacterium J06635_1]